MDQLERLSILFPALVDPNEEFKDFTSVKWKRVKHIVANESRITGKQKFEIRVKVCMFVGINISNELEMICK